LDFRSTNRFWSNRPVVNWLIRQPVFQSTALTVVDQTAVDLDLFILTCRSIDCQLIGWSFNKLSVNWLIDQWTCLSTEYESIDLSVNQLVNQLACLSIISQLAMDQPSVNWLEDQPSVNWLWINHQ